MGGSYKILHIMSYHSPWKWTDDQLAGFKSELAGLNVEYMLYQMDTYRNSSEEWKQKAGMEAREIIETWKPDLVYLNDDDAQKYVGSYYAGGDIPFVFGGVNRDPYEYGYAGSGNVTGVLEQEHFVESVKLLKEIAPEVERIAVVLDEGVSWDGVVKRMKQKQSLLADVKIVRWDRISTFGEYKAKIEEYQTSVDAIALIGIFTFKDAEGRNVPYQDVLRWTAEHSMLPDFSFWEDRISFGTLCTVTVSGYEQGRAAGRMARAILSEGKSPSEIPMRPSVKGEPVVSLARANRLGIRIRTGILLSSQVVEDFIWEK
ncbi:MAG: hypothetical protein JXQ30_04210 [Spirochaetes bacterium]|nr:hypothetical protein [Spirochaetota bacterium]